MLRNDTAHARRIIEGYERPIGFEKYSTIYRTSNENISLYSDQLKNKGSILSVTGSGDQILEMIYQNSFNIDAFDINVLANHYLNLKMAAIKSLTLDEYNEFVYTAKEVIKHEVFANLYFKIRENLSKNELYFWDHIMLKYHPIYLLDSNLFYNNSKLDKPSRRGTYLRNSNNYAELKEKISEAKINYINGDIQRIVNYNPCSYDTIYLSNIVDNLFVMKDDFHEAYKFLEKFHLNDNGEIINYFLLGSEKTLKKMYPDYSYGNLEFKSCDDGVEDTVITYKKHL